MINCLRSGCVESVALATFGSVDLGQQSRQRDVTAVTAGASGQAAAAIIQSFQAGRIVISNRERIRVSRG